MTEQQQIFRDFFPEALGISKGALRVLGKIDKAADLYRSRNVRFDQTRLYKKDYDRLEEQLKAKSKGQISLTTHRYRGIQLLRASE
jgi:homospermidine synthase